MLEDDREGERKWKGNKRQKIIRKGTERQKRQEEEENEKGKKGKEAQKQRENRENRREREKMQIFEWLQYICMHKSLQKRSEKSMCFNLKSPITILL